MDRMDRRITAATELLLIFPAALFLAAVVARHLQSLERTAQEIVTWYSLRMWTLWVLLIGLPCVALLNGCVALLRDSNDGTDKGHAVKQLFAAIRTELATLIIAAAALAAGLILAIVVLHMLAN